MEGLRFLSKFRVHGLLQNNTSKRAQTLYSYPNYKIQFRFLSFELKEKPPSSIVDRVKKREQIIQSKKIVFDDKFKGTKESEERTGWKEISKTNPSLLDEEANEQSSPSFDRKLTRDQMKELRKLRREEPTLWSFKRLSIQFKISTENVAKILHSRWEPTPEEGKRQDNQISINQKFVLPSQRLKEEVSRLTPLVELFLGRPSSVQVKEELVQSAKNIIKYTNIISRGDEPQNESYQPRKYQPSKENEPQSESYQPRKYQPSKGDEPQNESYQSKKSNGYESYQPRKYQPSKGNESYQPRKYQPSKGNEPQNESYQPRKYQPSKGNESYQPRKYQPSKGNESYQSRKYQPSKGNESYQSKKYQPSTEQKKIGEFENKK